MRALLVLLPIPFLAACSHSIPRVPPDYTDEVLARYPRPGFIAPPTTAERLADAVIRPVKPDRPALPEFEPLMIPAGIRNTKDGLYLDVWIVAQDAELLGRQMSASINGQEISPGQMFRITVDGRAIELSGPEIKARDFVGEFWPAPPYIGPFTLAPKGRLMGESGLLSLQPVMIRCEPILAETCTVEVLGSVQTRDMQTSLKGRSATVPVLPQ